MRLLGCMTAIAVGLTFTQAKKCPLEKDEQPKEGEYPYLNLDKMGLAVLNNDTEQVEALLTDEACDLTSKSVYSKELHMYSFTSLNLAAQHSSFEIVKALVEAPNTKIEQVININSRGYDELAQPTSPLWSAVNRNMTNNSTDMVELLVEAGADMEFRGILSHNRPQHG